MLIFSIILMIVGVVTLGLMTAVSIAEFVTKRRSNRREQSRIFFETLRAERKLHHLASDAFFSMMEVARLPESSHEPSPIDFSTYDINISRMRCSSGDI
jgi:hypothetical protein